MNKKYPNLALYLSHGTGTSHSLKFERFLSEAEAKKHIGFFDLIVSVRNLLESLKVVEHAIKEWDDFYEIQRSSRCNFNQAYANYRLATLLAMLSMLKGHVHKVLIPMIKGKKIDESGLEPWFKQNCRDGIFLKIAEDMRHSALHVRLPIHSYQVTKSVARPTLISLKIHSETSTDSRTQELEDFRNKLGIFIDDTCRRNLTSKFQEILNPAFEFYGALVSQGSSRSLENMFIHEVDSRDDVDAAASSPSYSFLGDYLLDLGLGFRP